MQKFGRLLSRRSPGETLVSRMCVCSPCKNPVAPNKPRYLTNIMKPKSLFCVPLSGDSPRAHRTDVSSRYRRHVDSGAPDQSPGQTEATAGVRLAFLPEKSYEPLVEEDRKQTKEDKKAKKKEKYKKYRKNVGKALRYSWKCLLLGLQNFSVGYSTPLSAAATFLPDFHAGGAWG